MNYSTKRHIIDAVSKVGVLIDNDTNNDTDLRDYIEDSVMFISAIIEIEDEFGVDLPDEFISLDNFSSIEKLSNIIDALVLENRNARNE